jgi:hypothetical protein
VGGGGSGDGGVDTVLNGAGGCGLAVSAVLVGVAEVAAKIDKGFVGVRFPLAFAAGDNEQTGGVDYVVSDADG